jgi:hypothetical protein
MGLRDVFANAAETIFIAAGDVPITTYYYAHATAVYDVSSGVVSTGVSLTVTSFIFENYKQIDVENKNIEPTDLKGTIPQARLAGVVPSVKDHIQIVEAGASVRYDVVNKKQDPAQATWELQFRKP